MVAVGIGVEAGIGLLFIISAELALVGLASQGLMNILVLKSGFTSFEDTCPVEKAIRERTLILICHECVLVGCSGSSNILPFYDIVPF